MTSKPMSCESLTSYLLGELGDEDMDSFEKHMRSCTYCHNEFQSLHSVNESLMSTFDEADNMAFSPDLKKVTLERAFSIRSPRPPQTTPWYRKLPFTRSYSLLQMTSTAAVVLILGIALGSIYAPSGASPATVSPSYMLNEITLQSSKASPGAKGVVMEYKEGQDNKLVVYVEHLQPLDDKWSCYTLWTTSDHARRNIGDFTVTATGDAVIPINSNGGIDPNSLSITLEPSWNDTTPEGPTVLVPHGSRV